MHVCRSFFASRTVRFAARSLLLACFTAAPASCTRSGPAGSPNPGPAPRSSTPSSASTTPEAPAPYVARCLPCHGPHGEGDGAAAAALNPRPRNFRNAEWQRATSDEALRTVITLGGMARGLSAAMPAQGEMPPAELDAIVRFIRALRP